MKFARDILIIDIRATGINAEKDFPLQLAGILLDKDNLLEKASFGSYIRHPFSQSTNDRIVQALGISKETWMKAPNLKTALAAFDSTFSYNVTLASQNIANINFFRNAYQRAGMNYEYDYHIVELWTLGYMFLSKMNMKKIPTAQTLGTYFNIPRGNEHDAFENCKFLAQIFKKLAANY